MAGGVGMVHVWVSLVAIVLAVFPARAMTYEPMTTDGFTVLLVTGQFDISDDITDFIEAVTISEAAVVSFNSPGGNVFSAMEHGRAIRALALDTVQLRSLECASACTLAFVGGVNRWAEPGAIGVHRNSLGAGAPHNRDEAADAVQAVTGEILSYLREMGVDAELLEMSMRYGADDMRYLSGSEMERMGVTRFPEEQGISPDASQHVERDMNDNIPPARQGQPARQSDQPHNLASAFVAGVITAHMMSEQRAIETVRKTYAATVRYYGSTTSLDEVMADKRAYFRRWPERSYSIRPGSTTTSCATSHCEVRGIYDWTVRSRARNRQASGTASFEFHVDLSSGDMLIIRESSEILSRE